MGKKITNKELLSHIKYLSNLDYCQDADDLQNHLEKINDLITIHQPKLIEIDELKSNDDE